MAGTKLMANEQLAGDTIHDSEKTFAENRCRHTKEGPVSGHNLAK